MQGKVDKKGMDISVNRITPACAGKRGNGGGTANVYKDHPCVCREKGFLPLFRTRFQGSPLRVQGKDFTRITPLFEFPDHPCVCREKNPYGAKNLTG